MVLPKISSYLQCFVVNLWADIKIPLTPVVLAKSPFIPVVPIEILCVLNFATLVGSSCAI